MSDLLPESHGKNAAIAAISCEGKGAKVRLVFPITRRP